MVRFKILSLTLFFVALFVSSVSSQDLISPDDAAIRMGASPSDRMEAAIDRFEDAETREDQESALADFERAKLEFEEQESQKLHGVSLFDNDVYKLGVRFCFNLIFVLLVVFLAYFRNRRASKSNVRTNVFSFLMMNTMVFFLCFALKKLEVELGLALGLFAIFTILRFRTDAIGIREMTYLFIVVGIAVINALSNRKTSYVELILANSTILVFALILERALATVKKKVRMARHSVVYDKMELIKPQFHQELIDDLSARLGLDVKEVSIKKINLKTETCVVDAFFETEEVTPEVDETNGSSPSDQES